MNFLYGLLSCKLNLLMSKTKNNRLLIPLISVSTHDARLKQQNQHKGLKDSMRKKELLMKAYENDSPMLPRHRFRKAQNKIGGISFQQRPVAQTNQPNLRYGSNKMDISEYLQEEKLHLDSGKPFISRSSRARPGSLFKIPQKSSVVDIKTGRHQRDLSSNRIEMSENHSVDLFKSKQNSQRRYSRMEDKGKTLLEMGRKLYREGKPQQAQKIFAEAIAEDPKLLEPYYFLAVISLNSRQFESAIDNLNKVISLKPQYKKSVYLFACIALKNLDRKEEAVIMASQGLSMFPSYYDLLIYRGKLYQSNGIYDLAEKDYDAALTVKEDNAEAFYKKGQCCVMAKDYRKALSALTTAIYIDQGFRFKALQQRAKAYLAINNNIEAKKDIDKLISQQPTSSENFQLKGTLLSHQGQISDAILAFQQCIKNSTSKPSMANALIQITKFKIQDRDFYSAYHHICRSDFLELSAPEIEMYRLFAEGVVFLMKRKTTEGLANLNKLEEKYPKMDDFIKKLFYLYRAYGFFVSGQHSRCLKDYQQTFQYQKNDRHANYNSLLAEGVVIAKQENYQKSIEYFNKAQELLPGKVEPFLYRAVVYVLSARKDFPDDQIKRLQGIFLALKELDKAYDINNSHSNQLFLRALVYYYLGKISEGLEDIGRAISKSEQNVPKYFFYRGMGQGTLRNYKQCQNDLTICINLDDNFTEAYYERAKAFFIQRQSQKALQDIAKYVQLSPKNDVNFLQANLYYGIGDFDEAIKRYKLSLPTKDSLTMLAKCYVILGEYSAAGKVLKQLQQKHPEEFLMDQAIIELLDVIRKDVDKGALQDIVVKLTESTKVAHQGVFSQVHAYHYLGVCLFYLGKYEQALEEFTKAYKQRELMNIENQLDSRDIRNALNSQGSQDEDPNIDRELHEMSYNQFLCQLAMGQYKKAYELFMRDVVPAKENVFQNELLAVFGRLLFQSLKKQSSQQSSSHPEDLQVTLFQNGLSSIVPPFQVQLRGCKVRTKPCFLSISPKLRQTNPQINPKQLLLKINLNEVQNKPEPPWVKRNQDEHLVFTNDIQEADDVEFNTEENQGEGEDEDDAEDEYEEDDDEEEDGDEEEESKPDIEKIRKAMRLDDSVEEKLNRLIKGGKHN